MLLRTSPAVVGTVDPVPTIHKRLLEANLGAFRQPTEIPGLDGRLLSAKYGGQAAYRPRWKQATFQVPLNAPQDSFQREQVTRVHSWLNEMARQGWDWCGNTRIYVTPGRYPAWDVVLNTWILDRREFVVYARFRQRNPKVVRREIPTHLLKPIVAPGAKSRSQNLEG